MLKFHIVSHVLSGATEFRTLVYSDYISRGDCSYKELCSILSDLQLYSQYPEYDEVFVEGYDYALSPEEIDFIQESWFEDWMLYLPTLLRSGCMLAYRDILQDESSVSDEFRIDYFLEYYAFKCGISGLEAELQKLFVEYDNELTADGDEKIQDENLAFSYICDDIWDDKATGDVSYNLIKLLESCIEVISRHIGLVVYTNSLTDYFRGGSDMILRVIKVDGTVLTGDSEKLSSPLL